MNTNSQYDSIIIGGGHNGLVTAAYLSQAGRRVLLLERRDLLGGAAATEALQPDCLINTGTQDAGLFRPEIVQDLGLHRYGLEWIHSPVALFAPQPDGRTLTLWRNWQENIDEIAPFSKADAEKYPAFIRFLERVTGVLDSVMLLTPPDLFALSPDEMMAWGKVGLQLRRLGKRDMMAFLRILPMPVKEFLDEWFESDALKGALGSSGIAGSMQGPMASGTTLTFLYHLLGQPNGGFRASAYVRGGVGHLSAILAQAAQDLGAEIRTGTTVDGILLDDERAVGVVLANGERLLAKTVVSGADPQRTFFNLIGAPELEPRFVRKVRNIRFRGCTAQVNLILSGLPAFAGQTGEAQLTGRILISPSLDYLERAYDNAKYGRVSTSPYLEVVIPTLSDPSLAPSGTHTMSIRMQYAPYHLREGDWDSKRDWLGDQIIEALTPYAPGLSDLIQHQQVITPLDWEQTYGLTEGNIFHGEMALDQMLIMRPVAGFGQYRTPIEKLYLCGAGTHPGGGVTGASGFNAAREILLDLEA